MTHTKNQHVPCQVCGKQFAPRDAMPAGMVRSTIVELIVKDHPQWSPDGYICLNDLDHYRSEYVQDVLEKQRGELTELEEEVIRSLHAHELVARDVNATFDRQLTLGERISDKVADFGGSWMFISLFFAAMLVWFVINSAWLVSKPFDPFPYILLNLCLSCLAAIQAPIIMMSQNRQEAKDRLRGEYDYRVNLKAELEIRHLNSKMDLLLTHEWQRLLEIQQVQTDLMQEIADARRRK
jgi:uncharacterized membrane protein